MGDAAASRSTVPKVRRVAVIGCGGAGKTTLANELGKRLGIPVVHIDSHYWQLASGRRVESTSEEWKASHRRLVARDEWVIDGMKLGVLDERLARADTVIYLDCSTAACVSGIIRRWVHYRGEDRPELGVYVRVNCEFLRWVCMFRRRQRPVLLSKLGTFEGETAILRGRREIKHYLKTIAPAPLA